MCNDRRCDAEHQHGYFVFCRSLLKLVSVCFSFIVFGAKTVKVSYQFCMVTVDSISILVAWLLYHFLFRDLLKQILV